MNLWISGVFLLGSLTLCFSFIFKTSHDTVSVGGTRAVELECDYLGGSNTTLTSINRIRIDRLVNGAWTLVSEIVDVNNHINNVDPAVTSSGDISTQGNPYLKVAWDVATANTPGTYRCDIVGMDAALDISVQKSDPVVISEIVTTSAPAIAGDPNLAQIIQNQISMQTQIDHLRDHTAQELSDILNLIRENQLAEFQLFNSIHNQLDSIAHKQSEMDNRLTILEGGTVTSPPSFTSTVGLTNAQTSGPTNSPTSPIPVTFDGQWPSGSYGLFRPATGCPSNSPFVTWTVGTRRHQTSTQYNDVSLNNHMVYPAMENINETFFINERFCMVDSPAFGSAWPKGSYCINRKGGVCPSGFRSGYINMEDIGTNENVFGSVPDGIYNAGSLIYYCCRNDSPPTAPISLPTAVPFYLYKYGDSCQTVAGMSVESEWFLIDTEDANNQDHYENEWHPSGSVNDVRVLLCYYFRN
ncbi:uncharacterized protein LOC106079802 isoform X2 [Biomphalaria glabrata]|nr:uncharacterized protein LOC106079802 isoform X2 [Biomphalaria glabrata]